MNDRPLHILLTDPHTHGGGQVRYLANLAGELVHLGHRVTFGCRPNSVLIEAAREAGCEAHAVFPFRGGFRPRSRYHDLSRLIRFVRAEKPDIVHTNLSQDHWTAGAMSALYRHPVCVVRTRHNTYPVRDTWVNKVLNRKWTDYQIVVCDVVRQTLAAQPTFDGSRMCSIHNGVDAELFAPDAAARSRIREELGYGDSDVVIGIAARLVKAKGHEFLFKALAQVKGELPNAKILVLGQGVLETELRALAEDLGITDRVTFAGFRDDMAACTQAFDIGVQPSIDCDTSSFSLKEQMAAEKPVIASDYGGLREIVTDGVEGLVAATGTVEPIAKALVTLANDPALRDAMGKRGRARVLREFTVQVFAARTVDAYRHALTLWRERAGRAAS